MSSFHIGYAAKVPYDLVRFIRRVLCLLFPLIMVLAALLIVVQQRFSPVFFEWQRVRIFRGVIEEHPYPTLVIERPGLAAGFSRYLLVAEGKHGASQEVAGFEGKSVELRGKLIYRPETTLIEVMPASIRASGGLHASEPIQFGGIVRVEGEIVDSKCYGGVMNPGSGKVHRDCAVRCLSGGVPPVLISTNTNGETVLYELADGDGSPLEKAKFINRVAEPVHITGRLACRGDENILAVQGIE